MGTIFLCGFMGCGKSTIGRELAGMLNLPFYDMDTYIEEKQGMTIPEIFHQKGEDFFRNCETDAIREMGEFGGVIACGGGAILRSVNSEIANQLGLVIYLSLPFDECYERISTDENRPIVQQNSREEMENIYNSRVPIYKDNSAIEIFTNDSPSKVACKICELIQGVIKG